MSRLRSCTRIKIICTSMVLLLSALGAVAQGLPSQSLTKGSWELQPFIGGGSGLGKSSNTQFLIAGARVGRIMTSEHFHNLFRGNFELARSEERRVGKECRRGGAGGE